MKQFLLISFSFMIFGSIRADDTGIPILKVTIHATPTRTFDILITSDKFAKISGYVPLLQFNDNDETAKWSDKTLMAHWHDILAHWRSEDLARLNKVIIPNIPVLIAAATEVNSPDLPPDRKAKDQDIIKRGSVLSNESYGMNLATSLVLRAIDEKLKTMH